MSWCFSDGGKKTLDIVLDIIIKSGSTGSESLVERWSFSLNLNPAPSDDLATFYKRLCIQLRSLRSLAITLPCYSFLRLASNASPSKSPNQSEITSLQITCDYKFNQSKENLKYRFTTENTCVKDFKTINHQLGSIKLAVEYVENVSAIIKLCKGIVDEEPEDLGMVDDFASSPDEDEEDEYEKFMRERLGKQTLQQNLQQALAPSPPKP